ncbi:ClpP/crotonase-like domain-containing protein [Peziza echinospora]|nr:ClpP/crotonase-like domain-containing protein [Peziza echinospora]
MPLRAKIASEASLASQQKKFMSSSPTRPATAPVQPENPDDEVLFASNYGVRAIELNRPKAYNALNGTMARKILERLQEYEKSQLANIIVIKGAGPKAFCAGGDVRVLAKQNRTEEGKPNKEGIRKSTEYFALEYTLDHLIATYSKPYVAFMDGATMGGGVGLSMHAPFRIATERTVFAMPETKIGFFPDVGASFFLPRMDGELGMYLALTSEMLKGVDTLYAGIATHYIHSSSLGDLEARLAELKFSDYASLEEKYEIVDSTIEEFNTGLPETPFSLAGEKRKLIDKCFSPSTLPEIITNLETHAETNPFIASTLATIRTRCPLSSLITTHLLRSGARWTISEAFAREYLLASRFMKSMDFTLGVRSVLDEKEANYPPKWTSGPLDHLLTHPALRDSLVRDYLEPKEGKDTRLPLPKRGSDYTVYPHWWIGLPSEAEIKRKVEETAMVEYFVGTRKGKVGVKEKVEEVLERKTGLDEAAHVFWLSELS